MIKITPEFYTPELLNSNPDDIYVFGDNVWRIGKAGQAAIRDESNAFGVATKYYPSSSKSSYFTDENGIGHHVIVNDIKKLYQLYSAGKTIVFPLNGLGTGLSQLPEKAPNLFNLLNAMLVEFFGITHGTEAEGYKLKRVVK